MPVPSQATPRQNRVFCGEEDEGRRGVVEDHRGEDDAGQVVQTFEQRWRCVRVRCGGKEERADVGSGLTCGSGDEAAHEEG